MAAPAARQRLLLAAERLIAERGIDVPLRDIAVAAGQRNNSAVHYYFGSRDGLIQAVLERRQDPLEARRLTLLAEHEAAGRADEPRALVELLVAPMLHVPYEDGATHYARFLEQIRNHPAIASPSLDPQHWPASKLIAARLQRSLVELPAAVRRRRLASMATAMFALIADQERTDEPMSPDSAASGELINMLVGLLTAPSPSR
jgi:AcrR family transcriptional regulator